MRSWGAAALLFSMLVTARAAAQSPDAAVPEPVTRGIDMYPRQGSAAALAEWTRSWDATSDSLALAQLRESLASIDESFGRFYGADIVRVSEIGPNVRRVYAVFRYDVRPLYVRFDTYRKADEWEVINMTWNVDPAQVMPLDMVQEDPAPVAE